MHQPAIESTARAATALAVALLVVTAGVPGIAAGTEGRTDPARPIDGCGTIDEPGEYVLQGNVTAAGNCLDVTADDVSIDGGGHTLAGGGDWIAVTASGVDNLTVRNVTLANWSTGVALRDVSDARIAGTTVADASIVGVSIEDGSRDVTIRNSTLANSSVGVRARSGTSDAAVVGTEFADLLGVGIDLRGDDARVVDSTFSSTGGAAVRATGIEGAVIANNTVRATIGGVSLTESAGVTVRANAFRNVQGVSVRVSGDGEVQQTPTRPKPGYRGVGVVFQPPTPASLFDDASTAGTADGGETGPSRYVDVTMAAPEPPEPVRIVGNTITDGNGNGIFVTNATSTTVADNHLVRNRDGVRIAGGGNATVVNNTATANRDDGITLATTAAGTVRNNTLRNNTDDGLYVVSDGAVVLNNTARSNGDDGVDIQNSTLVALRGNHLLYNGDDGLYLRNVVNATVERNVVVRNRDDGVDLRGTTGTVVVNNSVCANDHDDMIQREGAEGNTVENNGC